MRLDEYLNDLRELQGVSFQEYQENKLIHRTVERTLHLAIEACIDIGQHVIAEGGFRTPVNNKDTFTVLYEEGILSERIFEQASLMAQFRNLIVHDYARIDHSVVFGILKRHLEDFNAFAQAIVYYLEYID